MRLLSFATALLLAASAAHATPGTFAARDLTVNERSGVAIANVCRVGGSGTSKVTIQSAGVTAKAGTDYVALSKSLTFTIPMCLPVAITIINDAVHEPTETFQIILSAVSNATITRPRGTITILDDDPAPVPPPPAPPPNPVPSSTTLVATQSCKSLWDTPAWEAYVAAHPASLGQLPTIVAGQTYAVTSEPGGQQAGLVPNTYTGPFVVALPVSGPSLAGAEYAPACFPAAPANQWVSAPLQDGGFARVKANDSTWDMTGPGAGRQLVPGEIVAVYFNGWGVQADGGTSFAIYAFSDGSSGRALAADLDGIAPVGNPPDLPANWWVPGLVAADKTCTDPRQGHEGQPGVTQGGTYRAAMVAGSHMKLATGQTGDAGAMWQVFGSGDQNSPASATFTVVTGDCLTGQ